MYAGTEESCKAWIRKYNAGFFCRIAQKPMTEVLKACVDAETPKTPASMGMPAAVWSVVPIC